MNLKHLALAFLLITSPLFAQELTSTIAVSVKDSSGAGVVGASVEVTYQPTNTSVKRTTDSSGRANLVGLRPGGPYTVSASSALGSTSTPNVRLVVGDTSRVTLVIESNVEDVVVVAERLDGVPTDVGFSTFISSDDVEKYSSVTRDLKDFIRLNPFAVANDGQDEEYAMLSIGGIAGTSNDIKVDGNSYNDEFGLNANGYPGQNNPITLDSIDQINVRVAPVSVEYSQFGGGVVEVVSKGGTNEFSGSIYQYDRGDSYVGTKSKGKKYSPKFDDTSEGFSLGGPIIKDKLFFFVAYEENDKTNPVEYGPVGSGAPRSQPITIEQVDQIRADTISVYGFDPLRYTLSNSSVQENTTVRIDYYLNDSHRLQLNYRESISEALKGSNDGVGSYYFPSNEYLKPEDSEAKGFLLVSNWADNFSTELSYNNKTTLTGQTSPIGQETANFNIENAFGMYDIYLGVDPNRHANKLSTEVETVKFKGTVVNDNHTITFGIENKSWDIYNVYIYAQDGAYTFASYDDFLAKNPSRYTAVNSRDGTPDGGAAAFDYSIDAIFIQDEISLSDNLDLTIGFRNESFDGSAPPKNPSFLEDYGFENSGFDANIGDLQTYRLGLDYAFDNGDTLKFVHGTYSTRFPLVWISNAYSNNGMQTANFRSSATCNPTKFPDQVLTTQAQCVKDTIANASFRDAAVGSVAPNFNWPKMEVFNLTYETTINDWYVQASLLKKIYDQATYRALNIGYPLVDGKPIIPSLKAPDGRPIYAMESDNTYKAALYNISGSNSEMFTISGTKFFNGNDGVFTIGYANQEVNEVNGSTSSTINSSYGKHPNVDPNNPQPGTGMYQTEHRLFATLKSTHYFFGADKPTTFALFFERRSGYPTTPVFETDTPSYPYTTGAFGIEDAFNDDDANFISYIPNGIADPKVCWVSCTNPNLDFAKQAMQYIKDLGLDKYAGQIAEKGATETPWNTTLDLKITQILPGFRADDEFVITLGIQNLLNLIDDEKGEYTYPWYTRTYQIFDVEMTDLEAGQYQTYILSKADGYDWGVTNTSSTMSRWRAQLGFRYNFKF
jgi:hypothetical protein